MTNTIDIGKVKIIIAYLADKIDKLYVTKLMKLLYYIDFISYAETKGSSVTNDIYYKLPYGPVPSFVKNEIDNLEEPVMESEIKGQFADIIRLDNSKDKNGKVVVGKKKYDLKKLSQYEKDLIDEVIKKLGKKTASFLTSKTHREKPYLLTNNNSVIDYELAYRLGGRDVLSH